MSKGFLSKGRGGRGVFNCATCGRLCRQTRDTGDSECCFVCYELAGWENHRSDNGPLDDGDAAEVKRLAAEAVSLGGDRDKLIASFDTLELF